MDVYPATWTWRERYLATERLPGPPHHGLGRPMKVGKEEIAGLVVALRRFLTRDHAAERREQEERLSTIVAALDDIPGVTPELLDDRRAPRPYPTLTVRIDEAVVERSVEDLINALANGDPPICVSQNFLHDRAIGIVATTLKPGDEDVIARYVRHVLLG